MTIWKEDFVKVNKYTRPQLKMLDVRAIVLHYTATPKASAKNERDYFNGTCVEQGRYASAHLFVDKKEALLIMPLTEVAYHANDRSCKIPGLRASAHYYLGGNANLCTIGVEMCVEADGTIHADTITRTIQVVIELCKMYKLDAHDLLRHFDVTGKLCPAMWVDNPKSWNDFKLAVQEGLKAPVSPSKPSPANDTVTPVKKPSVKPQTPSATLPTGVFKQGSKGKAVKQIQDALNKLSFKCGVADGIWGAKTTDALKRFQSVYCNPVDGIYGAKTKQAMLEQLNKK